MSPLRTAVLASLLSGLVFACSEPAPTSLSTDKSAEAADDDDDSAADDDDDSTTTTGSSSTPAKSTTTASDDTKTTPATTTPATTTPATTTSSGGIGGIISKLPFKLTDIVGMVGGLAGKLGGLSGILNVLKGLGGGASSSGGLFGDGFAGEDPSDGVGCCSGTQFFACTSEVTVCSAANLKSANCERAPDLDEVCSGQ